MHISSSYRGVPARRAQRRARGTYASTLAGALALVLAATGCGDNNSPGVDAGPEPTPDAAAPDAAASDLSLVDTAEGPVRGTAEGELIAFRGIPYAAPPTGALRFAPPEAPAARDQELAADAYGPGCAQGPSGTPDFDPAETDEDCLYLNVFRPAEAGTYPVMVWIHGGAFVNGAGDAYEAPRLVARDVVLVTINYRLGVLGFLAHPALSAESEAEASGGYGIMDQQAALAWVRDNIAGFGGDPDNVTIFGESAGGHSVLTHLVSPASEGLFHKAIVQSGSYEPTQRSLADAEALGEDMASALGCADDDDIPACLRALSTEDILAAQAASTYLYLPNLRPDLLPQSIAAALADDAAADVPVIIGSNLDEARLFTAIQILQTGVLVPEAAYRDAIAASIGVPADMVDAAVAEYPVSDYGDGADATTLAVSAVGTDAGFACHAATQAGHLSDGNATYVYEFADRDAPNLLPADPGFDLGAAHALEISYLFGAEAEVVTRGMSSEQLAVSNAMLGYWTSFARTGDPSPEGSQAPAWPSRNDEDSLLSIGATIETQSADSFAEFHRCAFWAPATTPAPGVN